ncbi:DUF1858 domain-containing protein [Desulforapulum autotrophicum]|nr:DUF1858 domain-containing protein [Desulforapulum autotrophicum]
MESFSIKDITVKELIERYPKLVKLFMDLGLLCIGCPAEAFHTVEDIAKEYGCDLNTLVHEINRFIQDEDAVIN